MQLPALSPRRLAGVTAILCAAALARGAGWAATASPACGTDPVIAYVVNPASGTVTPIRTATNTALKAIKVGFAPLAIAITPSGKTAYVADALLNAVTPISTATGAAGKPIGAGEGPLVIAITPNGKSGYVADDRPLTAMPVVTTSPHASKPTELGGA